MNLKCLLLYTISLPLFLELLVVTAVVPIVRHAELNHFFVPLIFLSEFGLLYNLSFLWLYN
jgi:hypothetical protein